MHRGKLWLGQAMIATTTDVRSCDSQVWLHVLISYASSDRHSTASEPAKMKQSNIDIMVMH